MGITKRKLKIKGDKGSKVLNVVFDSGATRTVIRKDIAEKFCNIIYFDKPKSMIVANGENSIKAIGSADFIMDIEGCEIDDSMRVVDNLSEDMIVGASTLHKHKINMIFYEEKEFKLDFSQCKKRVEYI